MKNIEDWVTKLTDEDLLVLKQRFDLEIAFRRCQKLNVFSK